MFLYIAPPGICLMTSRFTGSLSFTVPSPSRPPMAHGPTTSGWNFWAMPSSTRWWRHTSLSNTPSNTRASSRPLAPKSCSAKALTASEPCSNSSLMSRPPHIRRRTTRISPAMPWRRLWARFTSTAATRPARTLSLDAS